jgi:hypothetical protein
MSRWQGTHALPPFGKLLKRWTFSIEACIQIRRFFVILLTLLSKTTLYRYGKVYKYRTVCMMVNLLDDSNFHRQTAVMTRLIEMII